MPVNNVAQKVTQRSGSYSGKGMLTSLLLIGFVLVAIRMVGDFSVVDNGTTIKANVVHPQGQYGPIPILVGLILSFFFLSFVAAGGGTRAKIAVIFAGTIIMSLAVSSYEEIAKVGGILGNIGKITAPAPTGQLADIFSNPGQAGGPPPPPPAAPVLGSASSSAPPSTGGSNPSVYTNQAGSPGGPANNPDTGIDQNPFQSVGIPGITDWLHKYTPGWIQDLFGG